MATMTAPSTTAPSIDREPMTVAELGLDRGVVRDLALKMLYYRGRLTKVELANELRLSMGVLEELLQGLTHDGFVMITGADGSDFGGSPFGSAASRWRV